jgi:hypothetical protein
MTILATSSSATTQKDSIMYGTPFLHFMTDDADSYMTSAAKAASSSNAIQRQIFRRTQRALGQFMELSLPGMRKLA